MSNIASMLAAMPEAQRREALNALPPGDLAALEFCWEVWARPDQLPPADNGWRTWLLLGGRGCGKTRTASEWVRSQMESGTRRQLGVIGPTSDSTRRIMIEGPSGLLACSPPWNRPSYEPSVRKLTYPNGGIVHVFSAEEPDRLRGPNLDGFWNDEITSQPLAAAVWDMLMMAVRTPGPKGDPPQGLVTTTPKPQALLKQIMLSPSTRITRARTSDNAANLDASTLNYLYEKYSGSRLGRQELDGELLEDMEGALWSRNMLESCHIQHAPEQLRRIVVAIDPAGSATRNSDETGIIVGGVDSAGVAYVLADLSGKYSPEGWARKAIGAYHGWKADRIVAEKNFGGDMVEATLKSVDHRVPVRMVTASRGKAIRAEPIVSFYEQGRVKHVGNLAGLEDQMCTWDPMESSHSPDRVDAAVWAMTDLMMGGAPMRINANALLLARRPSPVAWR